MIIQTQRSTKSKIGQGALCLLAALVFFSMADRSSLYAQDDSYRIGAEDVLNISVWENEQLAQDVTVRPDGKISFPLLDDLKVEGLTAIEIKEMITEKLTHYMSKPQVTVTVRNIESCKVYVMGAVSTPGVLSLKRKTNLLQLLAMVGGLTLTETADLQKAYILRKGNRLPVNFIKLVEEGDTTQNVDLRPDDVIYIPDNFDKRVTVIGEVVGPKTINFKNGITALDAVLMSGGPTTDADLDGTKIVRKKASQEEILNVKLNRVMKKGKLEGNVKLMPGDVIIVPASML
jgi:polysaccharide biosynthesis/export protein